MIVARKSLSLILFSLCGLSESSSIRAASGRGYITSITAPASVARTPANGQKKPINIESFSRRSSAPKHEGYSKLVWDESYVATPSPSFAGSSMASVMESIIVRTHLAQQVDLLQEVYLAMHQAHLVA
mmetsp:Transcript_22057/g.33683  ORF Transcript_22057/g.33683 Transcript_22057/m.33683 type:complete len:128 (+) Transcript_22057:1474-1857(+)